MADLYLALFFVSAICLIVGMIKPDIFSRVIKKELTRKNIGLIFGGAFIVSFVLFGITAEPTEKETPEAEPATQQTEPKEKETGEPEKITEPTEETEKEALDIEPTLEPETTSNEETTDEATLGEKNALNGALSYLDYTAFSYSRLIEQLEYEGFTDKEAVYGVDNSGADWNEQATLTAEAYLDYTSFSRLGLIEQLEYEGFTREQAEYAVEAVGY